MTAANAGLKKEKEELESQIATLTEEKKELAAGDLATALEIKELET